MKKKYYFNFLLILCGILSASSLLAQGSNDYPDILQLKVQQAKNDVNLTWHDPGAPIPFSYTDGFIVGAYQLADEADMAIRFTPDDLMGLGLDTRPITSVSYAVSEGGFKMDDLEFSIRIWQGDNLNSLDLVYTQPIEELSSDWNKIPLNEPYYVDPTKELWIGIHTKLVVMISSKVATFDRGPATPWKSDLVNENGEWKSWNELRGGSMDINWCIQAEATEIDKKSTPVQLSAQKKSSERPVLYQVERGGLLIAEVSSTSYTDEEIGNSPDEYDYCVIAVYEDNGTSEGVCETINVSTYSYPTDFYTSFDGDKIPEDWNLFETETSWKFAPIVGGIQGIPPFDGNFLWFDGFRYGVGKEGTIITEEIKLTQQKHYLAFELANVIRQYSTMYPGLKLFVDVSTDKGKTWISGSENIAARIEQYPRNAGATVISFDLSEYIDQQIKLRIRAVSDGGQSYLAIDNIRISGAVTQPELTVNAYRETYTQLPVRHAYINLSGAKLANIAADAESVSLNISVTPGDYDETLSFPALPGGNNINIIPNKPFVASENGLHTITYTAITENQVVNDKNSATSKIRVTEDIFSIDNGFAANAKYIQGTGCIGQVYYLFQPDVITAFQVNFATFDAPNFSLSIYEVNEKTNALTEIFTSDIIEKKGKEWKLEEYSIEPQTLKAGKYLFTVNQLDEKPIYVVCDDTDTRFYGISSGQLYEQPNSYGALHIRIKTDSSLLPSDVPLNMLSFTPLNGSNNVEIQAEISVKFDQYITAVDLSEISLKTADGVAIDIDPRIAGPVLFIGHPELDEFVKYTLNIPAGTIQNYTEPIEWSFTTKEGERIIPIAYKPENAAENAALQGEISVTFNQEINAVDLSLITITYDGDKILEGINPVVLGKVLKIEHPRLENNMAYTVVIPVGTINYDQDIEWFFTTVKTDNLSEIIYDILVYPTITTGPLNIESEQEINVKILDLTGNILHSYKNIRTLNTYLSYNPGMYIVKIDGRNYEKSYKIVLQ